MSENKTEGEKVVLSLTAMVNTVPTFPRMPVLDKQGFVKFGNNNLFPQNILEKNSKSSVHQSILRTLIEYTCGKGLAPSDEITDPNDNYSFDELIEYCANDYITFGGYYVQIIMNKDKKSFSFFHQPFTEIRISQIDKYGEPTHFKISSNWANQTHIFSNEIKEMQVWQGEQKAKEGEVYIFMYKDYTAGVSYYPLPFYYSSINYIEADGALGEYNKNALENGFFPSVIIKFPFSATEAQREALIRGLKNTYSGSKGINKIISLWGVSEEDMPQVEAFNATDNSKELIEIAKTILQNIVTAHRLPSPVIAGVSGGAGNLGSNGGEIATAIILYNSTVVAGFRKKLMRGINKIFKLNGSNHELELLDLDIIRVLQEMKKDADKTKKDEQTQGNTTN